MTARRITIGWAAIAAAGLTLAGCREQGPTSPANPPSPATVRYDRSGTQDHFNVKFTFTEETVTDADGSTVTGVTIRAASKQTNSGVDTTCSYFTADETFLGQFQSLAFASADADAVERFCVQHFADRTT